jgi:hypothetical protein
MAVETTFVINVVLYSQLLGLENGPAASAI